AAAELADLLEGDVRDRPGIAPQPLEGRVVQQHHRAVGGHADVDLDPAHGGGHRRSHGGEGVLAGSPGSFGVQATVGDQAGRGAHAGTVTGASSSLPSRYRSARVMRTPTSSPGSGASPVTKARRSV